MVIKTNVPSINAHRNLSNVGVGQSRAMNRLSSGYRINSAADDAAGLAISEKMRAQIRGLEQAERNTNDGISLITTMEGGMEGISGMMIRQRELLIQGLNDTNAESDKAALQAEIDQLLDEIDMVAVRTQFNGIPLLSVPQQTVQNSLTGPHSKFSDMAMLGFAETTVVPSFMGFLPATSPIEPTVLPVNDVDLGALVAAGVNVTNSDWSYNHVNRTLTILTDEAVSVTGSGAAGDPRIVVAAGVTDAKLILNNVNISTASAPAIDVSNATASIWMNGTNNLTATQTNEAAIRTVGGNVTLNGDGRAIINSAGAAIGGYTGTETGVITINSGDIRATTNGRNAAIGGGDGGTGGTININGGIVHALSVNITASGAGIGGGVGGNGGNITINGGTVVAESYGDGAGIGGGRGGHGGNITINDGTVTSVASNRNGAVDGGAGIGGGNLGNGGVITINGGNVTARADGVRIIVALNGTVAFTNVVDDFSYGAGIGGGYNGSGGIINILGGTVNAIGGSCTSCRVGGAGIGGGGGTNAGAGGVITIGTATSGLEPRVTANGGRFGATGIGGGGSERQVGGDGGTITINGGIVRANGTDGAPAVGGGVRANRGADVTINGGLLEIERGTIGVGPPGTNHGTLAVDGGNLSMVTPGTMVNSDGQPVYRIRIHMFDNAGNEIDFPPETQVQYILDINSPTPVTVNAITDSDGHLYMYMPLGSAHPTDPFGTITQAANPGLGISTTAYSGWLTSQESAHTNFLVFAPSIDAIPPVIGGIANRTSNSTATVNLNSNLPGEYFYIVRPNSDTSPPPTAAEMLASPDKFIVGSAGPASFDLDSLTNTGYRVYVMLRNEAAIQNNSNILRIPVPFQNISDGGGIVQPPVGGNNNGTAPQVVTPDVAPTQGDLWIHNGANSGQGMFVDRYNCRVEVLFKEFFDPNTITVNINGVPSEVTIDKLYTQPWEKATASLIALDGVLSKVAGFRATAGAQQNRLEYTAQSLGIAFTNLSESNSRIRDADMAKEMMLFTQATILEQAAVSMLSQANQAPNSVLQLLQN
jgi:flagellin-like hook-associated protein FlgL